MDDELGFEGMRAIYQSLRGIQHAITADASAGKDEAGGNVGSLTEAVMGITAGLCKIADALESVAAAIREHTAEN